MPHKKGKLFGTKYRQDQIPPSIDRNSANSPNDPKKRCKFYCISCCGARAEKNLSCRVCGISAAQYSSHKSPHTKSKHPFSEYAHFHKLNAAESALEKIKTDPTHIAKYVDPTCSDFLNSLSDSQRAKLPKALRTSTPSTTPLSSAPGPSISTNYAADSASNSNELPELKDSANEITLDNDDQDGDGDGTGDESDTGMACDEVLATKEKDGTPGNEVEMDLEELGSEAIEQDDSDENDENDEKDDAEEEIGFDLDNDIAVLGFKEPSRLDGGESTVQDVEMEYVDGDDNTVLVSDPALFSDDLPATASPSNSAASALPPSSSQIENQTQEPALKKVKLTGDAKTPNATPTATAPTKKIYTRCGGCGTQFEFQSELKNHYYELHGQKHCGYSSLDRIDYSKCVEGFAICLGSFGIDGKGSPLLKTLEDKSVVLAGGCGGDNCIFIAKTVQSVKQHDSWAISARLKKDSKLSAALDITSIPLTTCTIENESSVKVEKGLNACFGGNCTIEKCSYISKSVSATRVLVQKLAHEIGGINFNLLRAYRNEAISAQMEKKLQESSARNTDSFIKSEDNFNQIYSKLKAQPTQKLTPLDIATIIKAKLESIQSLSIAELVEKRQKLKERVDRDEDIEKLMVLGYPRKLSVDTRDVEERRLYFPRPAIPTTYVPPRPAQHRHVTFAPAQLRIPSPATDWSGFAALILERRAAAESTMETEEEMES